MPGGKRNPLSMTNMLETLGDVVSNAKNKTENKLNSKLDHMSGQLAPETSFVDLSIQFIGASGLPKMDVVGTADPYFIAKIDKRISFVSKVISNTLSPVWNEIWRVRNVPTSATLHITVMDKDEGAMTDDYVGEFETTIAEGAKEAEIVGPMFRRNRGTFWLKIDSTPTSDTTKAKEFPYLFDGPIRFSRHFSPTVGLLTNLDEARLYSTWKMYITGVPLFFGTQHQHWNRNYKAAQNIFQGPTSLAVRSGIQAGHRMLYARTSANGFGIIEKSTDVLGILHGGAGRPGSKNASIQMQHVKRVKPAVYTYIISSDDDSFRFSETGAAFFVDFASKHALHSNCNESVRYSGEFHPRPSGGWSNFSDETPDESVEWELVIDNNSGTYAPDKTLLPNLKQLLEYNFPEFTIHAWDREDPRLKESVEACREYSMKYRGVGTDELEPTANEGEITLSHQASMNAGKKQEDGGQGEDTGHSNDSDQPTHPQFGQDAHSSYYAPPPPPPPGQHNGTSAQAPHPPPPPNALPHTSSDYIKNPSLPHSTGFTSTPTNPPPQYEPLPNPHDSSALNAPNANENPNPSLSSRYPGPRARELPSALRPGSRPTSQDFSALPPGAMPPVQRNPGLAFEASASANANANVYGSAMMGRYDPARR